MTDEVSLRQHIEALLAETNLRNQQRFEAQTKAIDAALLAAEKAVTKAETATERRFESVNEFRQTLSDQTKTFISRIELESYVRSLTELSARVNIMSGSTIGSQTLWGFLIGAAGIAVALFVAFVK